LLCTHGSSRSRGSSDKIKDPGSYFRERVLPVLKQQPGFKSAHLLVDPTQGKLMGISLWESEQAAQAAREIPGPGRPRECGRLRYILLNPAFTVVGLGVAGGEGGTYFTVLLGG
jgi:hypothetical protein